MIQTDELPPPHLHRLVPDPEDPDYQGLRFLAAAYRTTRLLLLTRRLLNPGQSLNEAVQELVSADLLDIQAPFDPTTVMAPIGTLVGSIPTLPHKESEPKERQAIATAHAAAAVKLGYDPDDPVLAWMQPETFERCFPDTRELLVFDAEIVAAAGEQMVARGRAAASALLMCALGKPSTIERKDWASLPMSYLRDFSATSTDDDRTLMVARLEDIASRAKNSLDIRTELMALRMVATVQGLSFADESKGQRELLLLLGNRTRERSLQAAKSPHSVPRQITAPQAG